VSGDPLIEARHLTHTFAGRRRWWGRPARHFAVDDVSLAVRPTEMLGLVGESGSGKSTLARCLVGLLTPTHGEVCWQGQTTAGWDRERRRRFCREAQLVFQDTATSLNPRMRIGACVREPLDVHGDGTPDARDARVRDLLQQVGLDADVAARLPSELSGGQRQRVVLARALALSPALLVADEPVSSLDPSVQAQIMNLLLDVRERRGVTCVLIAHDLTLVERVCERVAVMCRGRLVELGPGPRLFDVPAHPYTRRLLAARLPMDASAADAPPPMPPAVADDELRRAWVEVGPDHFAAVG